MNFKAIYLIFSMCLIAQNALSLELCGNKEQGQILWGTSSSKDIKFNDTKPMLSKNKQFLIAFDRDAKTCQNLDIDGQSFDININKGKWDIQSLKGVQPSKVTPSETDLKDINKERTLVRTAQSIATSSAFWENGFILPVNGRISGKFGGQRIMNGIPKNPHMGLDIAAPTGTNILASGDGVITLSEKSLFYSGNVIVIDHGHGLFTIYAHLNENIAKKGDLVKKGDVIGKVGMTGRVTGPHLHWGASLNGTRFNPQSLLNIGKKDLCFNL